MQHRITPSPTVEEATAITAAIEALWPKPVAASASAHVNTAWRFSGRWWGTASTTRRSRPTRV